LGEHALGLGDAARDARGLDVDREREAGFEMEVALDAEAERSFDALKLGEADVAKLGAAEAEVAKAEQDAGLTVKRLRNGTACGSSPSSAARCCSSLGMKRSA
jgi:hypothetical protein